MPRPIGNFIRMLGLQDTAFFLLKTVERLQRFRKIARYHRTHEVQKLQIGSGSNIMAGWLNTDVLITDRSVRNPEITYLNALKRFPFADASFDYVFSEHMIEHISYAEGLHMLREVHRVLKPGGKVRISTPNLAFLCEMYNREKTELQQKYIKSTIKSYYPEVTALGLDDDTFVINNFVRNWGHQFIYDPKVFRKTLEAIGFVDVRQMEVGESDDPHLQGIEYHGNRIGPEFNKLESMVLEATKPEKQGVD